jgi:hypothetical protein
MRVSVYPIISAETMTSVSPKTFDACGSKKPEWFLPKAMPNYDAWVPKASSGYRVFRDKIDGRLFVCDERI